MGDQHKALVIAGLAGSLGGGGGGGTSDYTDLTNKPKINGVTLNGNKSTADLGIVEPWVGTAAEYAQQSASIPAGTPIIITDDQDIDTVPTQGSTNPITSGGVYNALPLFDATTGDIYIYDLQTAARKRIIHVMDSDSYEALTAKENIYYLTYPTPTTAPSLSMGGGAKDGESEEEPKEDIREEPMEEIKSEVGEEKELKESETKKNTEMEISDEQLEKLPPFGFGGYDE